MPLTRRNGHNIGYGAVGLGIAAVCAGVVNSNRSEGVTAGSVITAIGSFGAALWLLTRLYLSDPEARYEYHAQLRNLPLSRMLGLFSSIDNLVSILTPQSGEEEHMISAIAGMGSADHNVDAREIIRTKLHAELGTTRLQSLFLSQLLGVYTISQVCDLVNYDLIGVQDLRAMFMLDVEGARTFSDLAGLYETGLAKVARGFASFGVMRTGDVQRLIENEFPWIRHGFSGVGATIDGPHVITSMVTHFDVLMDVFGYTRTEISTIVERCPAFAHANLMECLDAGLDVLVRADITTLSFRDDLLSRIPVTGAALWELDAKHDVRYLLGARTMMCPTAVAKRGRGGGAHCTMGLVDLLSATEELRTGKVCGGSGSSTGANSTVGVISQKALRRLFAQAMPTQAAFGSHANNRATPQTNIAAFVLYWEDVLKENPNVVLPTAAGSLQEVHRRVTESAAPFRTAWARIGVLRKSSSLSPSCADELSRLERGLPALEEAFAIDCFEIHISVAPKLAEQIRTVDMRGNCGQM